MRTKVGLWMDNKNAIIVFASGKKINKIIVKFNSEKTNDAHGEFLFTFLESGKLNKKANAGHEMDHEPSNMYYQDVMRTIKNADSIRIYGNGESEDILKDQIIKNNLDMRIEGIETSDSFIIRKAVSRMQNYFLKQRMKN